MERPPADARDERDARAAEWAAQLATGPLPAAREAELRAWLDTDTRHRGALIRAQAALAALAQSPAQAVAAAPLKFQTANAYSLIRFLLKYRFL